MIVVKNPPREAWQGLLQRPAFDAVSLQEKVAAILNDIKTNGDEAVLKYTALYDGVQLDNFIVTKEEIAAAHQQISNELKAAIVLAANNIKTFHAKQLTAKKEVIETMPGIACWRKPVAIEKVGLYVPGGSAPLFSTVLMLAIPAQLAGCKEIVLCTPPAKNGTIHPAILFAAALTGVTTIIKAGGVQAIGAMAYGTESVSKVYKILGPGNQYVTCAKQLVQQEGIAIDMPAGPSEVCVLADESANAAFVAADLLSQAEHGVDSQVLLVTTSARLIEETTKEIGKQLENLPRQEIAVRALENSKMILLDNMEDMIAMVNEYAAEHLILACNNADAVAERIVNAGSVFIGNFSPESVGDYASGTNHTLPTHGFAKAYSGVSVDSFVKKITYQKLTQNGLNAIASSVITMAEAEGLRAHAEAVKIRVKG
ncbi:histidinol dehydrogenase [Ilyomonas limi]|uniref:Histidinol dehydrogenase n=1 Tax=Ilyomonas limi TaxID=2575867 RepID=A0A4U3KYQ7_9BACT|nr:histidinol dehydrogenase [Ilyomonas limi]TKK67768.1 histidinol dehydrogenase [Ilyomonas limi]